MLDFTFISTEQLVLDAEIVLKESSLETCSKECVTANGFSCKSFEYCQETKTCMLNSGDKKIKNSNASLQFDDCGHYRSEDFMMNFIFLLFYLCISNTRRLFFYNKYCF